MEIKAIIPFRPIFSIDEESIPFPFKECYTEFIDHFPDKYHSDESEIDNLKLTIISGSDEFYEIFQRVYFADTPFLGNSYFVIKSVATATITMESFEPPLKNHEQLELFKKGFAAHALSQHLTEILLAAQLSYPSLINTRRGVVFIDDEIHGFIPEQGGFLIGFFEPFLKLNWLEIRSIPFKQVWEWLQKQGVFSEYLGKTPIQRGICAFTHLHDRSSDDLSQLFWALVGLEAIFGRGRGDLRKQLAEKIQKYLGKLKAFKNIIGKLYDYRSLFIHGDLPFRPWKALDFEDAEQSRVEAESSKFSSIACSILTATLQKMVIEDRDSLEFELKIVE